MIEPSPLEHKVSQAEDGMKLTTFIQRRLTTPPPSSMLHKWIRSGQVRVNKKRAKPFQRLAEGDLVRIPPFAPLRPQETSLDQPLTTRVSLARDEIREEGGKKESLRNTENGRTEGAIAHREQKGHDEYKVSNHNKTHPHQQSPRPQQANGLLRYNGQSAVPHELTQLFSIIHQDKDVLVINKPSGLAVQPGSGLTDSVVHRLRLAYAKAPFIPAPAHRLDKNTSGLLAIGLTHSGLALLSEWFATPDHAHKHYFAWVQGNWESQDATLEDYLCKSTAGRHNMEVVGKNHPKGLFAQSHVTRLKTINQKKGLSSLLRVSLITGRTHQIRAQLSSRHAPIIGDVRYGGIAYTPMLLHAYEILLPDLPPLRCLPSWPAPYAISSLEAYGQSL